MKNTAKTITSIVLPFAISLIVAVGMPPVLASASQSNKDGGFYKITYKKDTRAENLQKFFKKYKSPLEPYSQAFVTEADRCNIDYRILPSIAGVESTFAKNYIKDTYNPFGWGSGKIKFNSFEHAISRMCDGLNEIYLKRGLNTVEKIAPVYNPPYPEKWAKNVNYFMREILEIATL